MGEGVFSYGVIREGSRQLIDNPMILAVTCAKFSIFLSARCIITQLICNNTCPDLQMQLSCV
jgi:hypothetical protein